MLFEPFSFRGTDERVLLCLALGSHTIRDDDTLGTSCLSNIIVLIA